MWVCSTRCRNQQLVGHVCISFEPRLPQAAVALQHAILDDSSAPLACAACEAAEPHLDDLDEDALLGRAVSAPALLTVRRLPRTFEMRFGDLLRRCLIEDAAAQVHARLQHAASEAAAIIATQRL